MKKLMIAAAIVCAAVVAQAANANWKIAAQGILDGTGVASKDTVYSGTAYVFNAKAITQEALFNAFAANQALDMTDQTGYVASGIVASGVINASTAANNFGSSCMTVGVRSLHNLI